MDGKDFIIFAVGMAILMPVAGITVRIALKPIVDSVARLMELRASMNASELMERRVALLEHAIARGGRAPGCWARPSRPPPRSNADTRELPYQQLAAHAARGDGTRGCFRR